MRKGKKNSMLFAIIPMLFVILFLSIGYSAFVDSLSISDALVKVRPEKFTRITSVTTGSSSISSLDYSMYEIQADANIAASETVTFNTTITTFSNVKTALSEIKVYDGSNDITSSVSITPDFTDPNGIKFIKVCDTINNSEVCTLNVSEPVSISITNNTGSPINTDNFRVALTFTPFYTITYNNTVIGDVLSGDTFTYIFQSNTPSSVTVDSGTCGSPYITGDTLTISNVTSDIVLTGTNSGGGSGPPNGTVVVNNPDGSTTTISYDSNGDPAEEVTESTDNSGNVTTEEFTYVNGEPVKTGYNIDSTGSSNKIQTLNTGLDTGVIAFDGNDFVVTLEAEYTFSDFSQSETNPIINISVSKDGVVNGILLTALFNYGGSAYNESGTSISSSSTNQYLKFRFARYNGGTVTGYDYYHKNGTNAFYTSRFVTRSTTFTFTTVIRYNSQSKTFSSEIYHGGEIIAKPRYTKSGSNYSETLIIFDRAVDDVTIQIGEWDNSGGNSFYTDFKINSFNVTKTIS